MSSKEIRKQFIEFFKEKQHKAVPSAPVIPIDDPTLLFTNAGMNQFKNIFLGQTKPAHLRVVNSQKCIRAGGKHNDLEEVGRDGYHHTFFEMLGNWSFGDYYKKEAINWAWELLTKVWKLPKDKLYATVHKTDEEAYNFWENETDIEHSHIEFHGDKDNFWEMAATGPCGPCSEIHIDRGLEFCNLKNDPNHKCRINGDCHRFIELWNLVFIQFYRDETGKLTPLSHKFVDTGAGFERIVQVLQKKDSNYHTDLFMPIIDKISELSGVQYKTNCRENAQQTQNKQEKQKQSSAYSVPSAVKSNSVNSVFSVLNYDGTSHRVIADHIRALSFALADGGMPSNEGRGYVLRRILRRAARHGHLLNMKEPFLHKLVDVVVDLMGDHFTELKEKQAHIKLIIKAEEERFNLTLDNGLKKFNEIIIKTGKIISGSDAFQLYDTYGFPLDLTRIMAEEKGLKVDEKGFKKEMEKQKKRAREAAKFDMKSEEIDWIELQPTTKTEFVGYLSNTVSCIIQKYFIDDKNNVKLVIEKTPFYAESGGQIADIGRIYNDECEIKISDVKKENDVFIHIGKLVSGEINDKEYTVAIDEENRKNITRNHTATHLLHKALREVLGEHVQQKGSFLHSDHLRFDFTHFQQVFRHELDIVEKTVNAKIRECIPVTTEIQNINAAKKAGAVALFGEKYDEKVRVVSIGDYSKELCGGTHLDYTGEIGLFKITSESSIAAGIRRIEAITGEKAEQYVKILEDEIDEIGRHLHAPSASILEKLQKMISENKQLHIQLKSVRVKSAGSAIDKLIQKAIIINNVKVVVARVNVPNPAIMRQVGDQLRNKLKSGIGVLFSKLEGKVSVLVVVTKDLTDRYHAGKIVGKVAEIVGGKGGGKPDMAMAGGKDASKINEAINQVPEILKELV
jgi:alanyl-tRNA synthetase